MSTAELSAKNVVEQVRSGSVDVDVANASMIGLIATGKLGAAEATSLLADIRKASEGSGKMVCKINANGHIFLLCPDIQCHSFALDKTYDVSINCPRELIGVLSSPDSTKFAGKDGSELTAKSIREKVHTAYKKAIDGETKEQREAFSVAAKLRREARTNKKKEDSDD